MENENMTTPEQNNTPQKNLMPLEPPEWTKNIVVSDKVWDLPEESAQPVLSENTVKYAPVEQESEISESGVTKTEIPMWKQIAVIVIGVIVVIAMSLYLRGVMNKNNEDVSSSASTTAVVNVTPATTSEALTSVSTTKENNVTEKNEISSVTGTVSEKTTVNDITEKEKEESDKKTTQAVTEGTKEQMAEKEIVRYFNDSINRVKPEAVKVVKNYEKHTHNADKLELPSVIKSIGGKMLDENMNEVLESVEYTAEELVEKFPLARRDISSELTTEEVKTAICTDMGNEYEITIVLENTVDPEPGTGVAKAIDCINAPAVKATAPEFITGFSAEYYDCVIRCRADKTSGRIVWVNYTTPVLVKLGLDASFTQFEAQIGFTFEKDYSIVY